MSVWESQPDQRPVVIALQHRSDGAARMRRRQRVSRLLLHRCPRAPAVSDRGRWLVLPPLTDTSRLALRGRLRGVSPHDDMSSASGASATISLNVVQHVERPLRHLERYRSGIQFSIIRGHECAPQGERDRPSLDMARGKHSRTFQRNFRTWARVDQIDRCVSVPLMAFPDLALG